LLFCAAAYVLARQLRVQDAITHFLPSLLYLHQLIYGVPSVISELTWSLEVEVQFYVLVPILTAIFLVRQPVLRRGILAGAILGWSIVSLPFVHTGAQLSIAYYLPFFLAGLLVCDIYLAHSKEWKPALSWDIAGIIGWSLVALLGLRWGHLALPFVIPLLFLSVFRGRVSSYLFSIPWVTNVGGMCYTIYLYHFVLMSTIGKLTKRFYLGGGFAGYYSLQAVLVLPGILGFCIIFFLLIEKPCMDKTWPSKLAAFLRGHTSRQPRELTDPVKTFT
jgi:peptidoglycan/LPS O-acetylase OafA/YrhL